MQANRSTDDDTGESSQPRRKSNSADVRKQRKRDTDRIAQREHRKRQRQYVQDLEVELAFLKQQPSHSQISQLCEENKQLRQEVNCYRQTILSIQSLIADETQAQVRPGGTASLTLSSPARASIAGAFTSPGSPSTDRARIDAVDAVHAVDAVGAGANEEEASPASGVPAESQPAFSITPPPTVAHNTQPVLHNIMYTDSGVDSNAALWLNDFRSPGSMRGLLDVDQFASGPHVTGHASSHQGMLWRFDLPHAANSPGPGPGPSPDRPAHDACSWLLNLTPPTPSYLMRTSPQDPDLPPQATAQAPAASGLPLHRMISCISTMPKPNDNGIYGIIDKVRSQSLSTPLSREKPTLAEFLLDNSSNMLSESLKEYLEAYRRSDKKSTFLAVYWTIYTLLVARPA
ncbi:hypothetical protein SBRCBS47491_010166 [Sporothrix bragantina]|uniref:BZIP domain-containing protein n=1 Tax=Sporothrix bragantina TaxID=671064 RepID=A0ABP0D096_9PEZI